LCFPSPKPSFKYIKVFYLLTSKGERTVLLHSYGMVLDGPLYETVIPCIEFTMEFQSNKLIYQKEYTKRQQIIYVLIQHLHDREGWGYRKISKWLNQSGIKTHRGKKWFNSSIISVLKRKHEYDLRIQQIRNQHFPTKISKFEVNYHIFNLIND
jgi:hypothetical protein